MSLTYDEAYRKAEDIIKQLENAPALSMDEYRRQAAEAERLLTYCRNCLKNVLTKNELQAEEEDLTANER